MLKRLLGQKILVIALVATGLMISSQLHVLVQDDGAIGGGEEILSSPSTLNTGGGNAIDGYSWTG